MGVHQALWASKAKTWTPLPQAKKSATAPMTLSSAPVLSAGRTCRRRCAMSAAPRAASRASVSGAWPVVDESEVSVGAVSSWPASAGEVTGGMISIVAGRPGSCGRIAGSSYPAARMAPPQGARGRADAVPAAAVVPYAARSRVKGATARPNCTDREGWLRGCDLSL